MNRNKNAIPITSPTLPPFSQILPLFKEMYASNMITNHVFVKKFERAVEKHLGVKHAIAINSCTSGLMLIIKSLNLTGEVIIPSFTFHATGHAVVWNNLTPIFADVDRQTYTVDPRDVEKKITAKTSAIIAVHLFGCPANIVQLEQLAKKHHLKLIFDAAHGFGIKYKGLPVGRFGTAESFSLSPTKLVTAAEGGIVTTNDDALAEKIRWGRVYGDNGDYNPQFSGLSARMSEFHAILGLASLRTLEQNVRRRNMLVNNYIQKLSLIPGLSFQHIDDGCRSGYKDFSLCVDSDKYGKSRDELAAILITQGISTKKYFSPPLHHISAFSRWNKAQNRLPNTEYLSKHSLSIPLYSHMKLSDCNRIISIIKQSSSKASATLRRF